MRILIDLLPTLEDELFFKYGPDTTTRIEEAPCGNNPISSQQIFEHS